MTTHTYTHARPTNLGQLRAQVVEFVAQIHGAPWLSWGLLRVQPLDLGHIELAGEWAIPILVVGILDKLLPGILRRVRFVVQDKARLRLDGVEEAAQDSRGLRWRS